MVDIELEEILRPHLPHGEKLQWADRPAQGLRFSNSDAFMIPFSLFWCMCVTEMTIAGIKSEMSFIYYPINFLFTIIGIYLLIGRFIIDIIDRKNTIYGITDKTIIIKYGIKKRITYITIKDISDITLDKYVDGLGTIWFDARKLEKEYASSDPDDKPTPKCLAFVYHVREVNSLITKLRNTALL